MPVPNIKLNNGLTMPGFGLGTWLAPPGEVGRAVKLAIDAGYRHFDCALLYQNEQEIGSAIREKIAEGVVKREDLFITSKLWNTYHRPDLVIKGCKKTVKNFGLDYIDLYLIHWPIGYKATDKADAESKELGDKVQIFQDEEFAPKDKDGNLIFSDDDYVDTWKEMEKCVELGLTRSIGVSNFNGPQIQRILDIAKIKPVNNQIEIHPYLTQKAIRDFCRANNISVTAYCPLGAATGTPLMNHVKVLDNENILKISKDINKTPAQVILRYLVQIGTVPIPKSTNADRLRQNIQIFDFELTPDQVKTIDALECNARICELPGSKTHKYYSW